MKKSSSTSSTKRKTPESVAEYLKQVDKTARGTLETLRQTIKATAPEAVEVISYGIPTFKLNGKMLVSYAAFTSHCSFFPGAVIEEFEDELKPYFTSKGTVRFPIDKPLPASLVKKIVKARMKRIQR
jgi:uncharacterized protein YdhG (YjbR/CyaY superfamily)